MKECGFKAHNTLKNTEVFTTMPYKNQLCFPSSEQFSKEPIFLDASNILMKIFHYKEPLVEYKGSINVKTSLDSNKTFIFKTEALHRVLSLCNLEQDSSPHVPEYVMLA